MGKPRHLMTDVERARVDEYQRAYREKNAQRLREYRHMPEVKARRMEATLAWKAEHADAVRAKDRERYSKDPSRKRASSAEYRRANPEAVRTAMAEWVAANPDKRREYSRNAKAKRKKSEGRHSRSDINTLHKLQRGCCAVCRCKLTTFHVDHVVPIARGGTNDRLNLQLLCPSCNLRKGAKDPIDFMQQKGFLL